MKKARDIEKLNRKTTTRRLGLLLVKSGIRAGYDRRERKPVALLPIGRSEEEA